MTQFARAGAVRAGPRAMPGCLQNGGDATARDGHPEIAINLSGGGCVSSGYDRSAILKTVV